MCCSVRAYTAAYSDAATLGQDAAAAEGEYLQLGGVKLHCMDGQVHAVSSTAKRRTVHVVRPPSSPQMLHAQLFDSLHVRVTLTPGPARADAEAQGAPAAGPHGGRQGARRAAVRAQRPGHCVVSGCGRQGALLTSAMVMSQLRRVSAQSAGGGGDGRGRAGLR